MKMIHVGWYAHEKVAKIAIIINYFIVSTLKVKGNGVRHKMSVI